MTLYDGIPALTIQQPWATAIARGLKGVENRNWKPRRALPFDLAIHAGLRLDPHTANRTMFSGWPVDTYPRGCVIAVCKVVGFVRIEDWPKEDDVWATGPWCWVLDQVKAIDPVFVRGHQGLWIYRTEATK